MAITNAEKKALQDGLAALKVDVTALTARVVKLEKPVTPPPPPPPPPPDTDADVSDDLKVTAANQTNKAAVSYTISGLDADAKATVTFKDSKAVTKADVLRATNGTYTVNLSALATGQVTATIKATDASNNTAIGASATMILGIVSQPPPPPIEGGAVTGIAASWLGPAQTVAATRAISTLFANYDDVFTNFENADNTQAAGWGTPYDEVNSNEMGAVYDRPKQYYIWADRLQTANPSLAATYRTRADNLCVAYHNVGNPTEPMRQWYSLAIHYLNTGNATSLARVGDEADRVAFYLAANRYHKDDQFIPASMRVVAHGLGGLLSAHKIGAPSDGASGGFPGGNNWATVLPLMLDAILDAQDADGGWRYWGYDYAVSAYQTGLLCGRLIDYYQYFNADSRIPTAVKKAHNFLWSDMLYAGRDGFGPRFYYAETFNLDGFGTPFDADGWTSDVNPMHLSSYGWLYHLTGDITHRDRGITLLTQWYGDGSGDGQTGGYFTTYKQLSEAMHDSYRFPYHYAATPLNVMDQGVPRCTVLPAITGGNGSGAVQICAPGTWTGSPTFAYQWKSIGPSTPLANVGANQNTFTRTASEVGKWLTCVVTATNGSGAGVPARSNETPTGT